MPRPSRLWPPIEPDPKRVILHCSACGGSLVYWPAEPVDDDRSPPCVQRWLGEHVDCATASTQAPEAG